MDLISVLPSPVDTLRTAVSLLNSVVSNRRLDRRHSVDTTGEHGIHPTYGFMASEPLPSLPLQFQAWEDALNEAPRVLCLGADKSQRAQEKIGLGNAWREQIRSLPVLDTTSLAMSLHLLQRAHMVLAWLVHFYAHSIPKENGDKTPTIIPQSLTVPLVRVSRILGIAPVLCFSDTVLWNMERVNPKQPFSIDNMQPRHLFSGTDDERGFYVASARTELIGAELLRLIENYRSLPNLTDLTSIHRVSRDLNRLSSVIKTMSDAIQSVRSLCEPRTFYWNIRPWYNGSDAEGPQGPTWIYEGVPDSDQLPLSGPSAGQSTAMHALDLFLDVDHKLEKRRHPAPSPANRKANTNFMTRMRIYMPRRHREYLERLDETPVSVRDLALKTACLREPFDNAVKELQNLRDMHMRIACLYILSMAKTLPPGQEHQEGEDQGHLSATRQGPMRGTGGNEVSLLLKAGRDATIRTMIHHNKK
jgi:indoleamine 2,3-dioxygenase